MADPKCGLCQAQASDLWFQDAQRDYYRCQRCLLVFVPAKFHLTSAAEKAEYDLHQNDPADAGYRRILSRLFDPLQTFIPPNASGLDFGAGPGPTLSVMLSEVGHTCAIYDKFYATDEAVFAQKYDFVTATEVFEHLALPAAELDRLTQILRPNGVLGIMTKLVRDQAAFANWHYKNDLTHVGFYSAETFTYIAQRWGFTVAYAERDVIILRKN